MGVKELIATMREFRARLLDLVGDLDDRQMIGPRLAIVNPPLWEIGHVAWFQEFWVLRHLRGERPILESGDRLYNSTDVAHDTRWELLLPNRDSTLSYMNEVLERCIARIDGKSELSPDEILLLLVGDVSRRDARRSARLHAPDPGLSAAAVYPAIRVG